MNRGSLRLRLFVAGAISVIAAMALSGFGLSLLFERHVERRIEAELGVHLNQIIAGLERDAAGNIVVGVPAADPRFAQPLSGLYWQVQTGDDILRSRSLWDARLELPADDLANGEVHIHRIRGPRSAGLIAVERSIELPARLGGSSVRATVALDSAEAAAARRAFTADLAPYLGLLALFLIGAAYVQIAVGLRPLNAVRERIAAIRAGTLHSLGDDFPDEIRPLATEVDALLAARDTQIERARARAGDLAHGLKTPLQVLSGDAARLRKKGEKNIADDIDQVATMMRRHVDRELARARMATAKPDARAEVAQTLQKIVAVSVRTPQGARLAWQVDAPEDLIARIDIDDLTEAIGNLTENAARHARTKVTIAAAAEGNEVAIRVSDDGPGISAEHIAKASTRGGRLDQSGSGLGLAIVREIADAWGGRIELHSGAGGFEAMFRVARAA